MHSAFGLVQLFRFAPCASAPFGFHSFRLSQSLPFSAKSTRPDAQARPKACRYGPQADGYTFSPPCGFQHLFPLHESTGAQRPARQRQKRNQMGHRHRPGSVHVAHGVAYYILSIRIRPLRLINKGGIRCGAAESISNLDMGRPGGVKERDPVFVNFVFFDIKAACSDIISAEPPQLLRRQALAAKIIPSTSMIRTPSSAWSI